MTTADNTHDNAAPETLGGRLIIARLECGSRMTPPRVVTQLAVAKHLGVSGSTIGGWEADKYEPGVGKLCALAKFYGVRVGWLMSGEAPKRAGDNGNAEFTT